MLVFALLFLRVYGFQNMDLVLLAVTVTSLLLLAFCLAMVAWGCYQLWRTRDAWQVEGAPLQLEVGYPNASGFAVPDLAKFPLLRVQWAMVYPDYIQCRQRESELGGELLEELIPQRRCKAETVRRYIWVEDVLGLCRMGRHYEQVSAIEALPKMEGIKNLPLLQSLTADEGIPRPDGQPTGDRMEIRPYVPGDSVRNILWKAFARSRQLTVRLPENSVFHNSKTLAYLLAGPEDEAAAAVARYAVESGMFGEDWCFGADGAVDLRDTTSGALSAIAQSRGIIEPHSYGLDAFLKNCEQGQRAHCIIFASAQHSPWLERLKATVKNHPGIPFSIVMATDGIYDGARSTPLWQQMLWRPVVQKGMARGQLPGAMASVSQWVESVIIVDRVSGHAVSSA